MAGRLEGRLAVVTGASRGIGAAVARRYAAEGAHVIALARTTGALEALDDAIKADGGAGATLVPVDLTELENIDRIAASLYERYGRIDVLASVAGQLGRLSPLSHVDPKSWDETLRLDLTVNHRLVRAFDPLLRQSEAGRAVFTTCARGRAPKAYWGLLAAAKAGLEAMVESYAEELGPSAVRANLVDPGPVMTRFRRQAFPGETDDAHPAPDDPTVTEPYVRLAMADCTLNGERLSRAEAEAA